MTTLGEQLVARRKAFQLSAAEVAQRAGISRAYLHELEHDQAVNPSADKLVRLASALGLVASDLLSAAANGSVHVGSVAVALRRARHLEEQLRDLQETVRWLVEDLERLSEPEATQ